MPDLPDFGLYIHWPFCAAKCPYCDFNSHVVANVDQGKWAAAFEAEIARVGRETSGRLVRSVFFGGGTPSLMSADTVERILNAVRATWSLSNDVEITLEANPTSIEARRFEGYAMAGVNRVSVGVQALNDADLRALGRMHSVSEALEALAVAKSVFSRVSFDLIYARQNQGLDQWWAELDTALAMEPDHLSLYQLTIEDGTAFGDRYAKGGLRGLPSEDLGADMWDVTQRLTEAAGLPGYETSNHAAPGAESRHNMLYWSGGDYAGIGPGAHGRLTMSGARYATETTLAPGAWRLGVEGHGSGESLRAKLSKAEVFEERLMMGLRLRTGVEIELDDPISHATFWQEAGALTQAGLLTFENEVLRTTATGRPLLNSILARLLSA